MIRLAVGAIIHDDNNYLLVHKVRAMDGKETIIEMGSWDFCKGGVKEGESALEAIKRELWEEIGCFDYMIEKEFQEKLCFEFSKEIADKIGYQSQETTMYLIRYMGGNRELSCIDDEIDKIEFYKKDDIYGKLANIETKKYWLKYVNSLLD